MERVDLDKIFYIEGMKDYLKIVTADRSILTLQNFQTMESNLPANFLRVHKSYIVAINKIKDIERNIINIHDKHVNIGISYREKFYEAINLNKL
jgi:DNA-binding LytR/AlgR family response regulator